MEDDLILFSFLVYSKSHLINFAFYIWVLSIGVWLPLGIFEDQRCQVTSVVFHLEQAAEAGALESVLKPRV